MNELCAKGTVELAGMIASLKVKSAEVVDAHPARIAEVKGPVFNRPLRVAVVRAGIDRGADLLANAGYDVVDVEPRPITKVAQSRFDTIWAGVERPRHRRTEQMPLRQLT